MEERGCKSCGWTKTGKTVDCEEPTEMICWEPIFECWKRRTNGNAQQQFQADSDGKPHSLT